MSLSNSEVSTGELARLLGLPPRRVADLICKGLFCLTNSNAGDQTLNLIKSVRAYDVFSIGAADLIDMETGEIR